MNLTIIVALITTLSSTLLSILTGQKVISASLQDLINKLIQAGATLFGLFRSGANAQTELAGVLTELQNGLAALQQDTAVDPVVLAQIGEAVRMTQAAIAGYQQAQLVTDPSTLTPLPE